MSIRIGIAGYGNLGRGAEAALRQNPDMRLAAVFTRRDIQPADKNTPVVPLVRAAEWKDKIDVMILCGGSASDLPEQTPMLAQWFNVVDSFDTHAKIPAHFAAVDAACRAAGTVGIISVGWDPGLFSLNRLYAQAVLPEGKDYTFWGKGVSQGHSDAIRRIPGVQDAKQYTLPVQSALDAVRAGENPPFCPYAKSIRGNVLWCWKKGPTRRAWSAILKRCPIILPITIPPCILFRRKNCKPATRGFRTADLCCEAALPAAQTSI